MPKAIYYLLDVFTKEAFSGNQLAIFPDAHHIPNDKLPALAKELNLSETVFLYKPTTVGADYKMRIFTPATELPTAGHPTIGTAIFIARDLPIENTKKWTVTLEQKIGNIDVDLTIENNQVREATMHQPLPTFGKIFNDRKKMASLVGLDEKDLLEYPIQLISCGVPYVIIPIKDLEAIKNIGFGLDVYNELKPSLNGAFIYAFTPTGENPNSHLHGRMFAPEAGILEDPATGSANGPLGCYVTHYGIKKPPFISEQGFEMGRPSLIHVAIDTNEKAGIIDVKVGGNAVFIGKGEIYL